MNFGNMTEGEIQDFYESTIAHLFPRLRYGLFHRMTLDSYRCVMSCGFIRPNDGSFPATYGVSPNSFGGKHGYISLFDFAAVDDRQFALQEGHHGSGWGSFFTKYEPVTVVLELDRELLSADLIPNIRYHPNQDKYKGEFYMPYVEAWYPVQIPTIAIKSRLLITQSPSYPLPVLFEEAEHDGEEFEEAVKRLIERWDSVKPLKKPSFLDGFSGEKILEMFEDAKKRGQIVQDN